MPWKRGDDDDSENGARQQNEFPAWASNKEYLAYNSPSATFLGEFFFNYFYFLLFLKRVEKSLNSKFLINSLNK